MEGVFFSQHFQPAVPGRAGGRGNEVGVLILTVASLPKKKIIEKFRADGRATDATLN